MAAKLSKRVAKPKADASLARIGSRLTAGPSPKQDLSISIRSISNGFIVCESGMVGRGNSRQYVSRETFSKTNPLKGK